MSKTVRIYYAGIPAKNKNQEKVDVLKNFHLGISSGYSTEVLTPDWQPSDLAVLQGWVHENSGNTPHLMFRKKVIQEQKRIGKHTLAIDSNLFLYRDPGNTKQYLRFSLDDVFPNSGTYFIDNVDPSRWMQIKTDLNFDLKPWTNKGKHILICLQRNGGWSMSGLDVMQWCKQTIDTIQKYSDRKIIVRAHPGDKKANHYLKLNYPNVSISNNNHILEDFHKCWAVVTYNSSPAIASVVEGIPVFITDPIPQRSQAYDVCNTDLKNIESPIRPDRQTWIEKISMSHFNFKDLKNGTAWKIIKDYI